MHMQMRPSNFSWLKRKRKEFLWRRKRNALKSVLNFVRGWHLRGHFHSGIPCSPLVEEPRNGLAKKIKMRDFTTWWVVSLIKLNFRIVGESKGENLGTLCACPENSRSVRSRPDLLFSYFLQEQVCNQSAAIFCKSSRDGKYFRMRYAKPIMDGIDGQGLREWRPHLGQYAQMQMIFAFSEWNGH